MSGKVLPAHARVGGRKDSHKDHGEGEPFTTRIVWLVEPGDGMAKCGCDHSLETYPGENAREGKAPFKMKGTRAQKQMDTNPATNRFYGGRP